MLVVDDYYNNCPDLQHCSLQVREIKRTPETIDSYNLEMLERTNLGLLPMLLIQPMM